MKCPFVGDDCINKICKGDVISTESVGNPEDCKLCLLSEILTELKIIYVELQVLNERKD